MPIPLLFIGAAAAAGLLGIGGAVSGAMDNSKAKDINNDANNLIEKSKDKLNTHRKLTGDSLDKLGELKLRVLNNDVKEFLETFEKIKNVELTESEGLNELHKFHVDKQTFKDLRKLEGFAASLVTGSAGGLVGGALTAFGAYGAATTFATASTGTAIASLSGAAATNATLAFFGGGSLAAGGLGVAGGAAVLGGLVAGPALLVMGLISGYKGSENLENARSNYAKAREIAEQLDTASAQCCAIRRRVYMFYNLMTRADAYFLPQIFKLEEIVSREGDDYRRYSIQSKRSVAAVCSTAGTIKAILDTPILTQDGKLTDKSEQVAGEIGLSLNKLDA